MAEYSPTVATTIGQVNTELTKISNELKTKVSRLEESSRVMTADLDMNSNRILNLPEPIHPTDVVRFVDLASAGIPNPQATDVSVTRKISVADLRAYDEPTIFHVVITSGYYGEEGVGSGVYILDQTDAVSLDNGCTVIVDALGRRWKLKHNGVVSILQAGFKADWNGTTGTDNSAALQAMFDDASIGTVLGAPGSYYFGTVPANTSKCTVTRNIAINWNTAKLYVKQAAPSSVSTSAAFIEARNTSLFDMCNYEFTDLDFSDAGVALDNRGIHPFVIMTTGTAGHINGSYSFGNCIVWKGQSLYAFSVFSSGDFGINSASGVRSYGTVYGDDVYYGGVHYFSGRNAEVRYKLRKFIRSMILNDVRDIKAEIITDGPNSATSASLLINCNGYVPIENVNIKGVYKGGINGPVRLSGPLAAGSAVSFKNCFFDLDIESVGANINPTSGSMVAIAQYDGNGVYVGTGDMTVQDVGIKLTTRVRTMSEYVLLQTRSPNVKRLYLDLPRLDPASFYMEKTVIRTPAGTVIGYRGDMLATPFTFDFRDIIGNTTGPFPFYVEVDVLRYRADDTTKRGMEKFFVYGSLSSGGLNIVQASTSVASYLAGISASVFTLYPTGNATAQLTTTGDVSSMDRTVITLRAFGHLANTGS